MLHIAMRAAKIFPQRRATTLVTHIATAIFAVFFCAGTPHAQQSDQSKVAAIHTSQTPTIDGRLTDPAWTQCRNAPRFIQRSPHPGIVAQERSDLCVLYSSDGLYVSVHLWDTQAHAIQHGYGPRDTAPESDYVTVFLDPLQTKERGYYFQISPAGVLTDGLIFNQTDRDSAWDGLWEAAATTDAMEWTAEFYIPLTSISFQNRPVQSWGIYVERHVHRTQEVSGFPALPPDSSNTFVSHFADLPALQNLHRRHSIFLQPYAALQLMLSQRASNLLPAQSYQPNGGLDAQYSLHRELKLAFSVNADYGQVEEDAAVITLGDESVYFEEKRKFFLVGADLFTTVVPSEYYGPLSLRSPLTLLHTKRIAEAPVDPAPVAGGELVEVDTATRLAGAIKLLGEHRRVSYGVLSATTMPTHATEVTPFGQRTQLTITPWTHYGAARVKLRFSPEANVGALFTATTRFAEANDTDAYVGTADLDWRTDAGWEVSGLTSLSYAKSQLAQQTAGMRDQTITQKPGYGVFVRAGQRGFPWRYWAELEIYSPYYDVNDHRLFVA